MGAAAIALAALSALVWGTADYGGGRASRRVSAATATFASQLIGMPALGLCLLLVPGSVHLTDMAWGAGAGAAGCLGLILLYRGLSGGSMSVVAPVTAVTGAVVPVLFGLATAERPHALALVGVGCAIAAIALVSLVPGNGAGAAIRASAIGTALLSGAMFGLFFVLLDRTADDSGLWPLLAARGASIPLALALVLAQREAILPRAALLGRGGITPWLILSGVGDITANALYLLAAREGLLTVVAPVAALYPVSTVLLALAIDREHVRSVQVAGLGLAAMALVFTAL
jgi:drug/metabolite transporter (DMT)-like permease